MIGTSKNRFTPLEVQHAELSKSVATTNTTRLKPRYFRFKAGTLNCRTASDEVKLALILRECAKAGLTFVCLQETRMMGKRDFEIIVDGENYYLCQHVDNLSFIIDISDTVFHYFHLDSGFVKQTWEGALKIEEKRLIILNKKIDISIYPRAPKRDKGIY